MKNILITTILILSIFQVFAQQTGTLTDARDGQVYETVKIGNQWWMAENLNYNCSGSYCYDNNDRIGEDFGRLYKYEVALNVCPDGWHLPNENEWKVLLDYVGGQNTTTAFDNLVEGGNYGFNAQFGGNYFTSQKKFWNFNETGFFTIGYQKDEYIDAVYFYSKEGNNTNNGKVKIMLSPCGRFDANSVRCIKN